MIDLHVHTTESDGGCSPKEVVCLAHRKGLRALALTDHDTVAGVSEAREQGQRLGVEIVPGVELSAKTKTGILHILGYYVQSESLLLQNCLNALRKDQDDLFSELLLKLQGSPVKDSLGRLDSKPAVGYATNARGRAHSASLCLAAGVEEVHDPLVRMGTKRYSPRANVLLEQAVQLIVAAGGVPVLAHPYSLIRYSNADWEEMLLRLVSQGIQGIEVYYPAHTPAQTAMFLRSAQEHGLVITGGSDFHGRINRIGGQIHNVDELGHVPGWSLDYALLEELRIRAEANRRSSHSGQIGRL